MTAEQMWRDFTDARGPVEADYEAWAFGGDPDGLAGLVLARRHMKRRGGPGWEWEYIHAVQGGRRIWRRLVCLALWLGLLWEIMLVLLFALLLSFPSFFF